MVDGQLSIAEIPTGMVEGDAPILALTAQPFISTNAFEQRLLYQLAKPVYKKTLQRFKQMTLYTSVWPFSGIYARPFFFLIVLTTVIITVFPEIVLYLPRLMSG